MSTVSGVKVLSVLRFAFMEIIEALDAPDMVPPELVDANRKITMATLSAILYAFSVEFKWPLRELCVHFGIPEKHIANICQMADETNAHLKRH